MLSGPPSFQPFTGGNKLRAGRRGEIRRGLRAVAAVALFTLGSAGSAQTPVNPSGQGGSSAYTVNCAEGASNADGCAVDRSTYVGWQLFHRTCHVCHAADAVGSDFAPNLLRRIRQMNGRTFLSAMETGYAGDAAMPPWGQNPYVRPYYVELWAYLSARASGDLPPGQPRILDAAH